MTELEWDITEENNIITVKVWIHKNNKIGYFCEIKKDANMCDAIKTLIHMFYLLFNNGGCD